MSLSGGGGASWYSPNATNINQIVAESGFPIIATLKPVRDSMPTMPVTKPKWAVTLLNRLFNMPGAVSSIPEERITIA